MKIVNVYQLYIVFIMYICLFVRYTADVDEFNFTSKDPYKIPRAKKGTMIVNI